MLNEKILRSILESLNYAIIVCDPDGNFLLWNKKAMDTILLDPTRTKQSEWQSYFGVYHMNKVPYDNQEMPIIKAAKYGHVTDKETMFIVNPNIPDGMYLEVDAFPIRDENDNIVAAAASFNDITHNVKMQEIFDEVTDRFDHMRQLIEKSLK